MIVVSDTTPLRYLFFLGHLELLPRLFGSVYCPDAVLRECRHPRAPAPLRKWAEAPPAWLIVDHVGDIDPDLADALDAGEAAAITLAQRLKADVILIDEREGPSLRPGAGLHHGWNSDHSRAVRHARLARFSCHRQSAAHRNQFPRNPGGGRLRLAGRPAGDVAIGLFSQPNRRALDHFRAGSSRCAPGPYPRIGGVTSVQLGKFVAQRKRIENRE